MLQYIMSGSSKIPEDKKPEYPSNDYSILTTTQRMNRAKWNNPLVAPCTLFVIPDNYKGKLHKISARLGMREKILWISNDLHLMPLTWSTFSIYKIVVITWSMWNYFVEKIDTEMFHHPRGYAFSRIVFDQFEHTWTTKHTTSREPLLNRMLPCQFVWYIDSQLMKVYEEIFRDGLMTINFSRFIAVNYNTELSFRRHLIESIVNELIDTYLYVVKLRRDDRYYSWLEQVNDTIKISLDIFDEEQYYANRIDFYSTMQTEMKKAEFLQSGEIATLQFIKYQLKNIIVNNVHTIYNPAQYNYNDFTEYTSVFSLYYGDRTINDLYKGGWTVSQVLDCINEFAFSTSNTIPTILVNTVETLNRVCRRFSSCIDVKYVYNYTCQLTEDNLYTMIDNVVYLERYESVFELFRHFYKTYPSLESAKTSMEQDDADIIHYYEEMQMRQLDPAKLKIAHQRHRTYRFCRNADANMCSICLDDLYGSMVVAGCCQTIYHTKCIMNAWNTSIQYEFNPSCPNCRSLPIDNRHTALIHGTTSDIPLFPTNPQRLESQLSQIIVDIFSKKTHLYPRILFVCDHIISSSIDYHEIRQTCMQRNEFQYLHKEAEHMPIEFITERSTERNYIPIFFIHRKPKKSDAEQSMSQVQMYITNYHFDYNRTITKMTEYLNTFEFDAIIQMGHIPYHMIHYYNDVYTKKIPIYILENKRY